MTNKDSFAELSPENQADRFAEMGKAALVRWGLEHADLELIKYRENAVFSIRAQDARYALRVHRPGYQTEASLRSELRWIDALSQSGVRVPNVVPTRDGHPYVSVPVSDFDEPVLIDLLDWIEGEQLGSVEEGIADADTLSDAYHHVGRLAALVHNQSAEWVPPQDFQRHAWDAQGLAGESPFWGRFWELEAATDEQRRLLDRTRNRLWQDLSALATTSDVYSMLHADLVPENVLMHRGSARLIDFDDAGFGWHLFELVTALYFIVGEPYYDQAHAATLDGYRSARPLPDAVLRHWDLLMLARSTTYLGWVHTRSETETAREMTPFLLESCLRLADAYLSEQ